MVWTIELSVEARKSLNKLDQPVLKRIDEFLSERLANLDDPRQIGEALKGEELGKYWKYRVGDWCIIASIEDAAIKIVVLRIGNRRDIYR